MDIFGNGAGKPRNFNRSKLGLELIIRDFKVYLSQDFNSTVNCGASEDLPLPNQCQLGKMKIPGDTNDRTNLTFQHDQ